MSQSALIDAHIKRLSDWRATRGAIDLRERDTLNEEALKALIRAAIQSNRDRG